MSFFSLLGLLFIGLKLTGFVSWSWWLVLLPLYGAFAFGAGLALLALVLGGLVSALGWWGRARRDCRRR